MKTIIIYSIIAIFTFGIISRGIVKLPKNKSHIIIETEKTLDRSQLEKSRTIISNRLKMLGSGDYQITLSPENQQIQIDFDNSWTRQEMIKISTQRGEIGFYETFDVQSVKDLLSKNEKLLSLLHTKASEISSSKIACLSEQDKILINQYLSNYPLGNQYIFVWDDIFDSSKKCLYLLKGNLNSGSFFHSNEIQNFHLSKSSDGKRETISFSFKNASVKSWADFTKRNIKKTVAITIDDKLLYMPIVQSEISGGNCEISGNFSHDELQYLNVIFSNGVLPCNFNVGK